MAKTRMSYSNYNPPRSRNMYDTKGKEPFKLSRSKIENFLRCPHCFFLDRKWGVDQPPSMPFNLNSAVDHLLKKEFDMHRANGKAHPLMEAYGIDAVPLRHKNMNTWRENFEGVQYLHEPTNFLVTGAVDDIWVNPKGEFIVVDYKSTSKDTEVNIDAEWQDGYKRQMEIYQWLLRKNGHKVSDTGYFVYCNAKRDSKAFDGKLEFDIKLIPYKGNDSWVDSALLKAKKCLTSETPPATSPDCDYCKYRHAATQVEAKKSPSRDSRKGANGSLF